MIVASFDPQAFGELSATVAQTAQTLDKHLAECSESNKVMGKEVSKQTRRIDQLTWAVGILVAAILYKEGLVSVLGRLVGP